MMKSFLLSLSAILLFTANSCGKKKKTVEEDASGGTLQTTFASGQLAISTNFGDTLKTLHNESLSSRWATDPSKIIGQTTPETLKSAKFRVSGITLCGQASTTDDSCKKNPWTLYSEGSRDISGV